jgi:DNA-binding NarL/FixJ family response regulator
MSITVLLADDHTLVRQGLRALLESHKDFEVVGEVADGREAVREAARLKPDIVIMDIAMPTLNGIEATQQILHESTTTKVIVLSMHATSEFIFRSFKAGAQGYLVKESAGAEVVDAVRAVCNGRRYMSEKITEKVLEDYLYQREMLDSERPFSRLSEREMQILQLVVEGKSSGEIGVQLFLSPKTVETYRSRLMQKLGINDLPGLVKFAIQHGLTAIDW